MGLIKSSEEIQIMREGGKILGNLLKELEEKVKPGTDSYELEEFFIKRCKDFNVIPTCKGYSDYGLPEFPTGLCLSINSESVHCIPKKGVIIKDGDVVTVDTVIMHKGLNVDASFSKAVGQANDIKQRLVKASQTALLASANEVRDGVRIGRISHKMQNVVESNGFNVLKDFAGHGIGKEMHEDPEIPCYGGKNDGPRLKEGMTICIEALTCSGDDTVISTGEWETKMDDGGYFAQFEHTILVTKNGYEILTLPD